MKDFASTPETAIRSSYLRWIANCTMHVALDVVTDLPDEGGAAAQNGSVTHRGVEAFHTTSGTHAAKLEAAFAAMRGCLQEFPLAEYNECRLFLTPYTSDPRNQAAEIVAIERKITFTLPPHPLDPTRQPIYIQGTLDQLRRENGKTLVCDLKTGMPSGLQMVHDYSYQIAAYTLGARQNGFPDAEPGYIIRARRYRERNAELPSPSGVFWSMPFAAKDCEMLLDQCRLNVALIRMGIVNFGTGPHCCYCTYRGLDGCIPRAKEKLGISLA